MRTLMIALSGLAAAASLAACQATADRMNPPAPPVQTPEPADEATPVEPPAPPVPLDTPPDAAPPDTAPDSTQEPPPDGTPPPTGRTGMAP